MLSHYHVSRLKLIRNAHTASPLMPSINNKNNQTAGSGRISTNKRLLPFSYSTIYEWLGHSVGSHPTLPNSVKPPSHGTINPGCNFRNQRGLNGDLVENCGKFCTASSFSSFESNPDLDIPIEELSSVAYFLDFPALI